ncbi:MAG: cohesin domain-containing protein, partial [Bacillota bacterium]
WNYRVVNDFDINTKTRLRLEEESQEDSIEVTASLDIDNLSNIKGMMMDISYDTTKIVRQGDIDLSIDGWDISVRSIREGSFSVLFYAKPLSPPIEDDTELFDMVFEKIGSGDPNIEINNIILSDGDEDIFLPDVKLN